MSITLNPTLTTESVRAALEDATQEKTTIEDVYNLCRAGGALYNAQIQRGAFDVRKVKKAIAHFVRRRLAAQYLGRVSPRFLDNSAARICTECGEVAVFWDGKTACINGHIY